MTEAETEWALALLAVALGGAPGGLRADGRHPAG